MLTIENSTQDIGNTWVREPLIAALLIKNMVHTFLTVHFDYCSDNKLQCTKHICSEWLSLIQSPPVWTSIRKAPGNQVLPVWILYLLLGRCEKSELKHLEKGMSGEKIYQFDKKKKKKPIWLELDWRHVVSRGCSKHTNYYCIKDSWEALKTGFIGTWGSRYKEL